MTESIFALIGTISAGVGRKVFEWLVNRAAKKRADAEKLEKDANKETFAERSQQIKDLKAEVVRLRQAQDGFEDEMLEWREKYWTLREEAVGQLVKLTSALDKIKELTIDDDNSTKPRTISGN